ncbi:MAG TPA: family 20 glycosylhydrolase [Candidatus Elarobacter sp.]
MIAARRAAALLLSALVCGCAQTLAGTFDGSPAPRKTALASPLAVVPLPRSVRAEPGGFAWRSPTTIAVAGEGSRETAELLRAFLRARHVATRDAGGGRAGVTLGVSPAAAPKLGPEGYTLRVRSGGIVARGNTAAGLFYALQTLEQITLARNGTLITPGVMISDGPRFRWRGIHLDVARHFFPVPVIERSIDLAARYKLNVFHWHLTDDQAWRLPVAGYPRLGASGPRYSREEIRAVVAYAKRHHVTVIPEIEMPAHTGAALRAYPSLACAHGVLCAHGAGARFVRIVVGEAARAFASPFLHVGGDEVPSPARLDQPQFTRAVVREVRAAHARPVIWDDAYDPGLDRGAVLMVWTRRARAAEFMRRGYDVVVASAPLYFDAVQGDPAQEPPGTRHMSTLEQVYSDEIVPRGVSETAAAAHLLGAQANLWTEHVAGDDRLFSMLLPRELALAENAWTPRERKSWPSFLARLPAQLAWLHEHGYAFRIPNVAFDVSGAPAAFVAIPGRVQSVDVRTSAPALTIRLSVPLHGAVVRYSTDGSAPSAASHAYTAPFTVRAAPAARTVRAKAFFGGRSGAITESVIRRVSPRALSAERQASRSWAALVSP